MNIIHSPIYPRIFRKPRVKMLSLYAKANSKLLNPMGKSKHKMVEVDEEGLCTLDDKL